MAVSVTLNYLNKSDEKYEPCEIFLNIQTDFAKLAAQSEYFRAIFTDLSPGQRVSFKNVSKRVFDHIFYFCDRMYSTEESLRGELYKHIYEFVRKDKRLDFKDFIYTCEQFNFDALLNIFR